jgi:uncharacterized protein (TIGR02466 family)
MSKARAKSRAKKAVPKSGQNPGKTDLASIPLLKSEETVALAFGTPIMTYQWPESENHNAGLIDAIHANKAKSQGMTRSNAGGWHSDVDLMTWPSPEMKVLQDRIFTMTRTITQATMQAPGGRTFDFKISAWANINTHGSYNRVHNHPNATWSGVYYVANGELEDGWPENGKLELVDPRVGIDMIHLEGTFMGGRTLIDPKPGLMIMFPSWLQHFVHPFYGEGERISIAFNIQASTRAIKK